ncbi:MAG TPA: DUF4321 domain-containing protein [Gemmatimonadota bacterium]|nr:DUF4321 domain-containing protein [Gemmatimonadota bacterium]
MEFGGTRKKTGRRILFIIAGGLLVGALLTQLVMAFPPSAARQFFVTTVSASLGPLSVDLRVIALTLGPLVIRVNVLSVVGVVLAAWFARSLL